MTKQQKAGPGNVVVSTVIPEDCYRYIKDQADSLGIKLSPMVARILRDYYAERGTYRLVRERNESGAANEEK